MIEVLVVGGGSAGLSAALVLGRARRRVVVIDRGQPRNGPAEASHSFFTRDGTPPAELLRIGRAQLQPYESVEVRAGEVAAIDRAPDGFAARLADGATLTSRIVLLASGVVDLLPPVEGLEALWGRSAFTCPYCHGWEVRDQPLAVLSSGPHALEFMRLLRQWSTDLVLCTNGPSGLDEPQRRQLSELGVALRETPIARLEGRGGQLERVVLDDGEALPRHALFVATQIRARSELARQLGCDTTDQGPIAGRIVVNRMGLTSAPGVYAAGDSASLMHQVVLAAASGMQAGAAINYELTHGKPVSLPAE